MVFDVARADRDPKRQDLFGIREAGIDVPQGLEAADHEPRGGEQHEREGHLRDDQRVSRPVPLCGRAASAPPRLERGHQVQAATAEGWKQPEQETGQEGNPQREREHRGIHRDLVEPGQCLRTHPHQQTHTAEGEAESGQSSEEPQHQALQEKLPDNLATAGPQSRANSDFLLTPLGPYEKESGGRVDQGRCRPQPPQIRTCGFFRIRLLDRWLRYARVAEWLTVIRGSG